MDTTKYNGWTNYATWRLQLEFFDGIDPREHFAGVTDAYELSEQLKEYLVGYLDEFGSGLTLDYAMAFINQVNYYEIAEHMIEDYGLGDETENDTVGVENENQ